MGEQKAANTVNGNKMDGKNMRNKRVTGNKMEGKKMKSGRIIADSMEGNKVVMKLMIIGADPVLAMKGGDWIKMRDSR